MSDDTNACPACDGGTLHVYSTRVDRDLKLRLRYRKCATCGYRCDGPQMIPLEYAPEVIQRKSKMSSGVSPAAEASS
ncbi:MAG: hypothetical protein AAF539_08175 [Planctomycetota bacterium]